MLVLIGCGRVGFDPFDAHDEDGDSVLDVDDVCPHRVDADQLDSDGDRVGDACDPAPTRPTESIAYFDPFVTRRPEWIYNRPPLGNVANDRLEIDGLGDAFNTRLPTVPAFDIYATAGRIDEIAGGQQQLSFVMYQEPSYYYCEITTDAASSRYNVSYTYDNAQYIALQNVTATPLAAGDFEFSLTHMPPNFACDTTWPVERSRLEAPFPVDIMPTSMFIRFKGMRGSLRYFIHIHSAI